MAEPSKKSDATRTVGIVGGLAALAAALGVAVFSGQPAEDAKAPASSAAEAPAPSPATPESPPADPVAEPAGIAAPPTIAKPAGAAKPPLAQPSTQVRRVDGRAPGNLEFIVKFIDGHPMAQAAEMDVSGKSAEAADLARATLRRRAELGGLCLQGFTIGGEVVLELCQPVADAKVESAARQWLRHIKAIRGVAYVDRNVVVDPAKKGPPVVVVP
jgi:hypothetical protein